MRKIKEGKQYRHFKGKIVTVICIAKDTETLEEKVIYQENNNIWVRDKEMFLSKVDKNKYPETHQTYRFEEI